VVTGIFEHEAGNVIDLYLAGTNEPIGCTDNHRFWSEDRKEYIEAGQLRAGERVWTRKLGSTTVAATAPRPGTHRVYNLEVHGEHVYEVGELGTLVHNEYPLYGVSGPAHHIVSHSKNSHRFRWSEAAQELLNDAGSNVRRSKFNKVRLPGHEGPHLELYPRRVPERLDEATTGIAPGSTLYKERVMHELRNIAKDVLADPRKLSGIGP
jgi:Protein of unknown function (DUF1557).